MGAVKNVCLSASLAAVYPLPAKAEGRLVSSQGVDWLIEPLMLAFGLVLLICISFFLWSRERRLRRQRERLRSTYNLGEEILSASSPETILKRVSASLTTVIGVTRVHLYVYNRGARRWIPSPPRIRNRCPFRLPRRPEARKPGRWLASITARCS